MTNANQVKLFPRLSIDSARRVRQLSQTLNGIIWSKCGKRTVKYLPKIAGPWLAGSHDSDRAAAKAAQSALALVFPTPERIAGLRKTFNTAILEHCKNAVLQESVQTLSDERTVSSDDAQGTYARVIATSLAVITSLLSEMSSEQLAKQHRSILVLPRAHLIVAAGELINQVQSSCVVVGCVLSRELTWLHVEVHGRLAREALLASA